MTKKKRQYRYTAEAEIVDQDQVEVTASTIEEALALAEQQLQDQNPGAMIQDIQVFRS
jgi:hypothetical protein